MSFQVPSIFSGDLLDTDDVFDWITKNVESSVVEEVTDEILEELIKDHEYVGVFFRGPCDEETDDCDAVLAKLESIDDASDEIGILLVTTSDKEVSKDNGDHSPDWLTDCINIFSIYLDVTEWPGLAMFRNGLMLTYTEDVQRATEKQLHDWLTAETTLKIIGVIDEVSRTTLY